MSIPVDENGAAFRHGCEELIEATRAKCKAEQQVIEADRRLLTAREQLNSAVIKMLARASKAALGPDGGK